ncbi:hypothetical protein MJO28_006990, partial [Puccinia striiformis f. sp. tritici]
WHKPYIDPLCTCGNYNPRIPISQGLSLLSGGPTHQRATVVCTLIHSHLMDPPNNPIELEKQSCHGKKVLLVCKILQNPPTKMTPKEFMFHFATKILIKEEPTRGLYPDRGFQSSTTVSAQFFAKQAGEDHDCMISTLHLFEGQESLTKKVIVARCCQNYLQLHNSVRFYACGVSERVQECLNYLGLCLSRRTATSAMISLAEESYFILRRFMRRKEGHPWAPTICINNIDMEQKVQQLSVGNRLVTFHGTWGNIHLPDHALRLTLDFDQMNLKAYQDAICKVEQLQIELTMFLPSPKDEDVQDYNSAIPTEPPTVKKIRQQTQMVGCGNTWKRLGFRWRRPFSKKNFTLMVNQMERVFEATIYYCLRFVYSSLTYSGHENRHEEDV